MALGHALLHPGRLREALAADALADNIATASDVALGMAGFGDPGPAATAWAERLIERVKPLGDRLGRIAGQGPLAALLEPLSAGTEALEARASRLLHALEALDPDALRRTLTALLDTLLDALPDLRVPALRDLIRTELDAALGILEEPLRAGRRDAAAHRSFRTAAEIRRRLAPLAAELPPGVANLDLKAALRGHALGVLNAMDPADLRALASQIGAFRTEFGPLLDALSRVSVKVEVGAGGPQPMAAGAPDHTDEDKVTPFPRGHTLWTVDLISGALACLNLFWEMIRSQNFRGRGWDGAASVLLLIWQIVRTVVRVGWPDDLAGFGRGSQWLFSDQGDFVLSVGLRALMAVAYDRPASNFVGSVLVRALKHVTAVSQPRMLYQWLRALWYFDSWNEAPAASRGKPAFLRTLWAAWGPAWTVASLGGLLPPWSDFHLEGMTDAAIAWLVISAAISLLLGIQQLSKQSDFTAPEPDLATRILMAAFTGLTLILVSILVSGVESKSIGRAIFWLVVSAIALAAVFVLVFAAPESGFLAHLLIGLTGVFCAYLVPFVLWWVYIDDGRDKPGLFDRLDADTSPYRLPFPRGESWLCSQGTHGIFSHHTYSATAEDHVSDRNHYAYDFNENEGQQVVAARDGIVIARNDDNPNRQDKANSLDVLHLDWLAGHDHGSDDERQLSAGTYFHVMQHSIGPGLNQPIARGQPVARCDSTGISAQHHIHFAAMEHQSLRLRSLPLVFGDDNAKGFRHYPLLAWIRGKGKLAGKPVAYAYYRSDNSAPAAAPAAALEFTLAEPGAGTPHLHRVVIPAAVVGGTADAVVSAGPSLGHTHQVTLSRAAIDDLLRADPGWPRAGVVVAAGPDGHTHPALRFPLTTLSLDLKDATGTASGPTPHGHSVEIDLRGLLDRPLAAQTYASSKHFFRPSGTPPPPLFRHQHDVTVQPAALLDMLHRRPFAASDIAVASFDSHRHALASTRPGRMRRGLSGLTPLIVTPPTARMIATTPGPYRMMGEQAALRVNDRTTEAWLAGAHRAALIADVPAERGVAVAEPLLLDRVGTLAPAVDTRATPRAAARQLTLAARALGGAAVHVAATATPLLVIETRARGAAARLRLGAADEALFGKTPPESRGAGDLPDLQSFAPADLAALLDRFLKNGWPAAPPGARNAFAPGGPVIDPAPSAPRTAAVLRRAVNSADNSLFAAHGLPLQPGYAGVTAGYAVPILAAPAVVRLDLAAPAMAGAARQATPLTVAINGFDQRVSFRAADADAAAVARRIMLQADGVRAVPDGAGTVVVATVAGGSDLQLALSKPGPTPLAISGNGLSAVPSGHGPVTDTGAVTAAVLRGVVADAAARSTLPYNPAAVQPAAALDGNRLLLTVAAGHRIRLVAQGLSLVSGSDPAAVAWRSDPLAAGLTLAGSSWIDLEVDGAALRVPLTGEPARLELGPLPRLPAAGEVLELRLGATTVTVTFDGSDADIGAVAARIAAASDQIAVRFAWQMAVVQTLHGAGSGPSPLRLLESDGLAILGFVGDRAVLVDHPEGAFSDHLGAGPRGPIAEPDPDAGVRGRFFGPMSSSFTVLAAGAPGLAAPAGRTLKATPQVGADPLAFSPAANEVRASAGLPLALARGCVTWQFELLQGSVVQADAIGQLAAMPAALRATVPPVDQGAAAALTLTVVRPNPDRTLPAATIDSPAVTIDLAGMGDAADACERLMRAPGVVAFPVTFDDGRVVVQVETVGRGTRWRLRLAGRAGILALGFRPPAVDLATDTLEAAGGGTVADGAAVTADEVRAMLDRAVATATDRQGTPPLYTLSVPSGGGLRLAPSGPALAFGAQPAAAAAALGATAGTDGSQTIAAATVAPGPALLQVLAGAQHTTLPLLGRAAVLRAPNPPPADGTPDATAQLAFLQAHGLDVRVDGVPRRVPAAPAPFATVADAVEWIARHVAPGWAGLQAEPATAAPAHLVLRGARRGSAGTIAVTFPAVTFPAVPALPAGGLLGLTSSGASGVGAGTVADVDAISVAGGSGSLKDLLGARAALPEAPQALFRAVGDDTAGTLRLLPNGVGTILGSSAPAALGFTTAAGTLVATPGRARALDPALIGLTAQRPGEENRTIPVALWGRSARLPPLALPANLAVLATRQLQLLVNGSALTVTLRAPADPADLCAQIDRGANWTVRAFIAGGLVLETIAEGSRAQLSLTGGSAVTGNPATGLVAPAALPIAATGDGSLPDMANAKPSEIAAAVQAAWTERDRTVDDSARLQQPLDATAYAANAATGDGLVLASRRRGVAGRLTWLAGAAFGAPIVWDESLSRGAAERAAIALPRFAGTLAANGDLPIGLDENTAADLPAPRTVTVPFDGTALTAAEIAARIDATLRAAGAGAAAAWPDGAVVIETASPGLAGSVRIPARGAPRGASDVLLQGGGDLCARGWPGAGRSDPLTAMTPGLRGVRATAKVAASYSFIIPGPAAGPPAVTAGPIAITAGATPEAAARLINAAFEAAATGGVARIGLAGVVGDALCVEAIDLGLVFQVDGSPPKTAAAAAPGTTPELAPEPAFDLRRTDWLRTVRLTLASSDDAAFAGARDLQYLRPPADIDTAQPAGWDQFPLGRWLVAVRPDAARVGDAPDAAALRRATAMAILHSTPAAPANRASPQILRFWPALSNGREASLRGASSAVAAEPFLVDLLTWQR